MSAGIGGPLGSGQKDVQRLRSYRGNCRVEHQCGTGSERPGHYRHTYSRIQRGSAGLASASGTGRCRGGVVSCRAGSRSRLSPAIPVDRHAVCRRSLRCAGNADLSHGRSRAVDARPTAGVSRAHRCPSQSPWVPHRTRGSRGGTADAPARGPGGDGRLERRRQGSVDRLRGSRSRSECRSARRPRPCRQAPAVVHGAGGGGGARRRSADGSRKTRPRSASHTRFLVRRHTRPATANGNRESSCRSVRAGSRSRRGRSA